MTLQISGNFEEDGETIARLRAALEEIAAGAPAAACIARDALDAEERTALPGYTQYTNYRP